jgi:hypothetical protein
MGRSTHHLRGLLLVAVLLASTLTTWSHHVGTPQHPGRASHIHPPQHAAPRPAGRYVALPLRSIEPRDAWFTRPLRWDAVPAAVASLLAHARTRDPPLTEPVAASAHRCPLAVARQAADPERWALLRARAARDTINLAGAKRVPPVPLPCVTHASDGTPAVALS